jgi:hypothetical protein
LRPGLVVARRAIRLKETICKRLQAKGLRPAAELENPPAAKRGHLPETNVVFRRKRLARWDLGAGGSDGFLSFAAPIDLRRGVNGAWSAQRT